MIDCMFSPDKVYRLETARREVSNLFRSNSYFKYICNIAIYDNIMNRKIIDLNLDEDNMIRLCEKLYSYMSFGGYNESLRNVFFNDLNNRTIYLNKDIENYFDYIIITEYNRLLNCNIVKLKIPFSDEYMDSSFFDLFVLLYESFLKDIVSLEDLAPDFYCD